MYPEGRWCMVFSCIKGIGRLSGFFKEVGNPLGEAPICSKENVLGRVVTLTGKHGGGTDCSCTLQVSSSDQFAMYPVTFTETRTPSGCQYALKFEFGTLQRLYSCSQPGSPQYTMYPEDILTLSIVSGSTRSGGFDFSFNVTSSTPSSEITLACQQTPPDATSSTPIPTTSTSQTTTSTSTTTSSDQLTSSSTSGNSQTTDSGGETTSSGGGTTSSNDKPPTPKPSVSGTTDDTMVIPVTTDDSPAKSTEPTSISTGAIIGATLGVILLFVVLVVILLCVWKKKLKQNKVGAS
ncbi:hypothetical protein LOTGIDRAFT_173269 [Lottia gigantea]|uniref:CUB domain-containing protein n=1 Tax=Lottia gigantea TaxID=225164 RepID=V4AYQ4_LOTGI|nr:hypothetical protein LOTGIDRAFT_173269 [Lottia gigantea]ESP00306.1 hypothetical protein LOTGIDRAFT_173269 [Lottia gigantea]